MSDRGAVLVLAVLWIALPACTAPALPGRPPGPLPPPRSGTERRPAAAGDYGPEPSVTPSPLEEAGLAAARARLGVAGASLRTSAALVLAARELARNAADGEADPLAPPRLHASLTSALAFDPAPIAHLAIGDPATAPGALADAVSRPAGATHLGVGAVMRGNRAYLVLLLVRRTASLLPFPRAAAPGTVASLRGELIGLARATIHVTRPSGESRTIAASTASTGRFSAPISFDAPGRWRVEVVGDGPFGPEVAVLLTTACGGAALTEPSQPSDPPDPADDREAEERVVSALNATRRRQRLPPLEAWPALAEVARRHSRSMLAAGVLAHRLPGSEGPGERLRLARVPFALVLENVAKGPGALAAHRLAEESPAHRQNMLSREATRVGCGIARGSLATGERIVYLTELFVQPVEDGADDRLTPEARVREAVWRERSRLGAPPLVSDAALDAMARDAARAMLRRDDPGPSGLAESAIAAGRKLAAADGFVASKVADATRSRNLPDARFRRIGVGVVVGDSKRFGAGLLWIAVIYTD